MTVRCSRCGAPNRCSGREELCCVFCTRRFVPSAGQLRRAQEEAQVEHLHQARAPINVWASAAVFLTTVVLLLGMYTPLGRGNFGEVSFWVFPLWLTALIAGALMLYRFDRYETLLTLRKSVSVILAVLVMPVLYQALPRDIRTGNWRAIVQPQSAQEDRPAVQVGTMARR